MPKMFALTEGGKCGGCNWPASVLYAYAETQQEAEDLYTSGDAGLCGDCMCDLLVETGYDIMPTDKQVKERLEDATKI